MSKIYDAHNHWMPSAVAKNTAFFRQGWSDVKLLLDSLDKAGVEKALLLYPTSDAHLNMGGWQKLCAVYNKEIAALVKAYPDRLIGAGILPADTPKEMPSEVERIRSMGLRGLSLASSYGGKYLDDECFCPVFEQAEKLNLPVFVHSQIINPIGFERVRDPLLTPVVEYLFDITISCGRLLMSGALSRSKDLKLVFAHFAGVLPFLGDRFDSTYTMLRQRNFVKDLSCIPTEILKKVHIDTSGVTSKAMLAMALEFFGPERILWGSDFPAKRNLKESIEAVNKIDIEEKAKNDILGGNLTKLF